MQELGSHDFLAGVRVLDLSQYLPGPFAARLFADLGADVVKVEPPSGDPLRSLSEQGGIGRSPFYGTINAGKRVIFVDLKTDEGRDAFTRLLTAADVLLESYRPDVLDRLGFGPLRIVDINPRLIHCALSGFGQSGPLRLTPGHDIGYTAMTGTLSAIANEAGPAVPYPPLADHAGAFYAVTAMLGALYARERTGRGAFLDLSLMESLLALQAPPLTFAPGPDGGIINGGAAFYNIYRTADDRFVTISPIEAKFWDIFCRTVGRPDWLPRRFDPLPQKELKAEIQALFASQPLAYWDALLLPAECCYQAVLTYAEVPDHPQVAARGFVHPRDGAIDVTFPAYVDGNPPVQRPSVEDVSVEAVLEGWKAR